MTPTHRAKTFWDSDCRILSRLCVAEWIGLRASKASLFQKKLAENFPWALRQDGNSGRNFRKFAARIMALAQMMQKCPKRHFARAFLAKRPRRSAHGNSKRRPKASNVPPRAPETCPKHHPKDPEEPPKRASKPTPKQISQIFRLRGLQPPVFGGPKTPQTLQLP